MDFIDWLLTKQKEDSPTGDLAQDVAFDLRTGWKPAARNYDNLRGRMALSNASPEALEALEAAHKEWQAS